MAKKQYADIAAEVARVAAALGRTIDATRCCFSPRSVRFEHASRRCSEVTRRARDVIGAEIVAQLATLDDKRLFADVIAGWESYMGSRARPSGPPG